MEARILGLSDIQDLQPKWKQGGNVYSMSQSWIDRLCGIKRCSTWRETFKEITACALDYLFWDV